MNHPLSTPRRLLLASPSAIASIALLMAASSSRGDPRQAAAAARGPAARRCPWPAQACICAARAGAFVTDTSLERSST